jgi:hypothetical protein
MACSAARSIALSADGRDFVHDTRSPVTLASAMAATTAGPKILGLVLIRLVRAAPSPNSAKGLVCLEPN